MAGAQEDSQAKILDGSKPGSQQRRVYFAGSIRGGRDDAELYASIVSHMQSLGVNVLTEHVAEPALSAAGESESFETFIYKRDMEWLRSSHLVVAEVTQPSLGVGYELGAAEALGIPVVCLFRPASGRSLSAMLRGNKAFRVVEYASLAEAAAWLDENLLLAAAGAAAARPKAQGSEQDK